MGEATERRRLREDLHPIGIAGVALLRLHAMRDPTAAHACLEEMRKLLDRVDGRSSLEESTPLVDVVTGYDRWAEVYDLPGNPLVECEEHAMRLLLDHFDEDPVLDAACGTGRHLAYLAARGRRVIGTDLSQEMIAKARQKVPDADLRLGDLVQLPVADGEVRATICALALEHVDVLEPVYSEFARVTASGGTVLISTMHPVLRSVYGWGAWFVDDQGKTDVPSFEHSLSDHINAATGCGLVLRQCREPSLPASSMPPDMPATARIAYDRLPMVLVLEFERP